MLALIHHLNSIPPGLLWIIQLVVCYTSVLVMLRLFGKSGLYIFITITIIAANIQVLKIVKFGLFPEPIALGTVLFTAAYLSTDTLTEYYGTAAAKKGVLLAFAGMIIMLLSMIIAMGFKPITEAQALADHLPHAVRVQPSLITIFSPDAALLSASLLSFLISQFCDIWIFKKIRIATGKRWLWLRNNVSTIAAALIDNIVFNVLAWKIFAHYGMSWHALIYSYILGTYVLRVLISVLDTPFIYFAKYMLPKADRVKEARYVVTQ